MLKDNENACNYRELIFHPKKMQTIIESVSILTYSYEMAVINSIELYKF